MVWVKSPTGGWVQEGGTPTRPTPPIRPKTNPKMEMAGMTGLELEFWRSPVAFMRNHPVSPPNSAGARDAGRLIRELTIDLSQWADLPADHASSKNPKLGIRDAGGRRFIRFNKPPSITRPDALSFTFEDDPSTGAVPIEWLPWESMFVVQHQIAAVPASLVDPSPVTYPRLFFTAGITGCSIMITGDPTAPFVAHGGTEGKLAMDPGTFWRSQLLGGGHAAPVRGGVDAPDYSRGAPLDAQMQAYLSWIGRDDPGQYQLEYLGKFGSVFGVRYGRSWTFYLQKNYVAQRFTLHKASAVKKQGNRYVLKSNGQPVTVHGTERVKRSLGPLNFGSTEQKVFASQGTVYSRPMEVGEVYPRRLITTDLKAEWSARRV